MSDIPAGFRPLAIQGGFVEANGPLYGKREGDNIVLALRIEQRHCNMRGVAHGGLLMMLADMVLGFVANWGIDGRRFMPTVNATCDFLAPARLGDWVEGRGRLVRATRNLAFSDCVLAVADAPVLRANGILKVPAEPDGVIDIAKLFD